MWWEHIPSHLLPLPGLDVNQVHNFGKLDCALHDTVPICSDPCMPMAWHLLFVLETILEALENLCGSLVISVQYLPTKFPFTFIFSRENYPAFLCVNNILYILSYNLYDMIVIHIAICLQKQSFVMSQNWDKQRKQKHKEQFLL